MVKFVIVAARSFVCMCMSIFANAGGPLNVWVFQKHSSCAVAEYKNLLYEAMENKIIKKEFLGWQREKEHKISKSIGVFVKHPKVPLPSLFPTVVSHLIMWLDEDDKIVRFGWMCGEEWKKMIKILIEERKKKRLAMKLLQRLNV